MLALIFRCSVIVLLLGVQAMADIGSVAEIRRLSEAEIEEKPAVELTARVTFVAAWRGRAEVSLQDDSEGIYTYIDYPRSLDLKLGDELLIRGNVQTGVGPPCLSVRELTRTGRNFLPEPGKADFAGLESFSCDSQFTELQGIVRDVQYDPAVAPPSTIVTLQMEGGRAEAFLFLDASAQLSQLIDSEVRIRGVVFHYFNQSRQPIGFRVMTCDPSQFQLVKSPATPAFELPLTPIANLLRYEREGQPGHRVRVRGVVTLHWPGDFLYIQDGGMGILVKSRGMQALRPGDLVDIAGFPAMSGYSAILEDAVFQKVDSGQTPEAPVIPLEGLATGEQAARLVTVEGTLESISERNGHAVLLMRKGRFLASAELPVSQGEVPPIQSGSLLRLKGVCLVELGSKRKFAALYRPESGKLLLQSGADISVVDPAPWWTARRLQIALAAVAGVLALVMIWLWTLQSRNLRLKSEVAARLRAEDEVRRREEERKLLAADLHDSLEQSLTGVALQLQAAKNKPKDSPHLELAERLLKHSREEVHRAVRDLREPVDEDFDLYAALNDLIKRSAIGSPVAFHLELPPGQPAIPSHLSHQLLRLVQESVTNALKHAEAANIRVELAIDDSRAHLRIEDDGKGWNRGEAPGPAEGHFGLQGMKERAARLDGTFSIDSAPGKGTRIHVMLPLAP